MAAIAFVPYDRVPDVGQAQRSQVQRDPDFPCPERRLHVSGVHEDGRNGWWDLMVGPGLAFDTNRYFVICANVLGGCKGSTGPSSINPAIGKPYAKEFPVITINDMVRAQRPLLDVLGIAKLHAVTGGSMGGMLALAFTQLYPEMTERAVILASAHANHAQAIAWNKIGRRAIMNDPLWRNGNYYDQPEGPPKHGLAVARMIGHVTYISEGAMDRKFGRSLQTAEKESYSFGVDYSIESYLAYQGQIFHQRFACELVPLHHAGHRLLRLLGEDRRRSRGGLRPNLRALSFPFVRRRLALLARPHERDGHCRKGRTSRSGASQNSRPSRPRCLPRPKGTANGADPRISRLTFDPKKGFTLIL